MTAIGGDDALRELQEQTRWLRLLGVQQLRPLLQSLLTTPTQRLIYELSDGLRSVRDIGSLAKVGSATVSRLWNQWAAQGVAAASDRYPGRARHLMKLSDLGMEVPDLPASSEAKPTTNESAQDQETT